MNILRHFTFLVIFCFWGMLSADSNIRSVQADFDRCETDMERVKRELLRFEQAVKRCRRLLSQNNGLQQRFTDDVAKYENRVDYFRGRIDRSFGQRDKIRTDLRNIKGTTCPSCITSSVELYCRNSENLTNDINDYISQITALEDNIISAGGKDSSTPSSSDTPPVSFSRRRAAIDTTLSRSKEQLDKCSSGTGTILLRQCTINLQRADSLNAAGAVEQSFTALNLADHLLIKALSACKGK